MTVNSAGVLTWANPVAGSYPVTVTAKDSKTALTAQGILSVVIAPAKPPVVASAAVSGRAEHERILTTYGCALFRATLLGHNTGGYLSGDLLPWGVMTQNVFRAFEHSRRLTIDNFEDGNSTGWTHISDFTGSIDEMVCAAVGTRCLVWTYFGRYIWDREAERWVAFVIDVLTLRGSEIAAVTAFLGGDWFPRVGLPAQLPEPTAPPASA